MTQETLPDKTKSIITRHENYGIFDIPLGLDIEEAHRQAAKLAATEHLEIRYTFNQIDYSIKPNEAKNYLTVENIKAAIKRYEGALTAHQRMIQKFKGSIEEEEQLGRILYPEEFGNS